MESTDNFATRRAYSLIRLTLSLARSRRGNVAMLTAFSVIPLLAMVGGAVDASRTYMAYTRLQQACDSGALAGRRAMANVNTFSSGEQAKANEFFDFNFPAQTYGALNISRTFARGAVGVVTGQASLSMPATLMKMFGYTTIPLRVTCEATLNIPNTDVMFVLDVTGSMAWTPSGATTSNDTLTRLYGLKQAVKDFYSALGPGAASGPGRVRYGFMPYNSNVNVGRVVYALDPSYIAGGTGNESWSYPSRTGTATRGGVAWTWVQNRSVALSPWVTGTGDVANPAYWPGGSYSDNGDAPSRFSWDGCILEAKTVATITATTPLSVPVGADDLQIDLKPTALASKWKPALRPLLYRSSSTRISGDDCPQEARPLAIYANDYNSSTKRSAAFDAYVDSLTEDGGTYHDVGLMWGARFLSPFGIFSATNSDTVAPGGYQVSRHIVFMTDGALDTSDYWPDAWGVNQINGQIAPASAGKPRMDESHLRRTQIICNEMKGRGFTIWIIGFGSNGGLSPELKACATDDDHWSQASDTTALRATFAKIAQTIGGLRLSS